MSESHPPISGNPRSSAVRSAVDHGLTHTVNVRFTNGEGAVFKRQTPDNPAHLDETPSSYDYPHTTDKFDQLRKYSVSPRLAREEAQEVLPRKLLWLESSTRRKQSLR